MGALQIAFACGCGSDDLVRSGFCVRCDRRQRLSRENFAGLREAALRRDNYQCQTCAELDPEQIVVHHRRPGFNLLRWLITLCRGCHIRVHLANWRGYSFQGLLRALWREMNPGPEQRAFRFTAPPPVQVELFQNPAGIWVPRDTDRYVSAVSELTLQMPA